MKTRCTLGVTRILIEGCARIWWRRFNPNEGIREDDERGCVQFGRKPRWEDVNGKREKVFEVTEDEICDLIFQLTGSHPEVQTLTSFSIGYRG